ncbi:MAG: glycosyltransferase family 2 protein [Anaerolineales bacterium]|nr:glycosyltransferase [Anaerolineales bacterium]MCS7248417.1 glycosyltransferase [Anaerolineales bacterium]MDW8162230.1 glycosyltransferase family 2 protein [Anaerolineales bacterium]MDW8446383.1 glycosyltransferase family 2 protein [Anaerolineales bacterium]
MGLGSLRSCSVVIRAYNEENHIGRLLEGIAHQTVKAVEVILVDSGSTDRTVEIARGYGAQIERIEPQQFTFGRSLNLGLHRATQDLVVIASAHVYPVYPDWLERLLAPFEDEKVALTYGKQRGNEQSRFSERQIFLQWYGERTNLSQAHPFCNNANAAIRRRLWQQHPYDETLSGLEDLAWAKWALEQGYRIAYVAEAEVIHIHHETPRAVYNRYRREAMALKRIFPQETFTFRDFLRLTLSNVINDLWHAHQSKELRLHWREILWFRFMQFWGTYCGYRQAGHLTWELRRTFYYPRGLKEARVASLTRNVAPIRYNETYAQEEKLK